MIRCTKKLHRSGQQLVKQVFDLKIDTSQSNEGIKCISKKPRLYA